MSEKERERYVALIKAAGQEIIDRAEDMVGEGDYISDLTIWVSLADGKVPTIEVQREHLVKNSFSVFTEGMQKRRGYKSEEDK